MPITVEQLLTLNDEIRLLVASNIPLNAGLRQVASLQRGRVAEIAAELSRRLESGQALSEAILDEGDFPPVYAAVVAAGVRAGRLPAALEGISNYARELVELRRQIGLSLLYPFVVVWLAYELGIAIVSRGVSAMHVMMLESRLEQGWLLKAVYALFSTLENWQWIPRAALLLLFVWWLYSRRLDVARLTSRRSIFGWIPGMRRIAHRYRCASFAELLALLVENRVPLPEGLVLAAESTGDAGMRAAADSLGHALRQGESASSVTQASAIPPLLTWLATRREGEQQLANSLRLAGDVYRRQAQQWIRFVCSTFPILAGIGIGGVVTLIYALTLFGPLIELFQAMSNDVLPT